MIQQGGQERVTAALLARQVSTLFWLTVFEEVTGQIVPSVPVGEICLVKHLCREGKDFSL